MRETYLGDGAYVRETDDGVVLYTSNGIYESNHVYLERHMYAKLFEFMAGTP